MSLARRMVMLSNSEYACNLPEMAVVQKSVGIACESGTVIFFFFLSREMQEMHVANE